MRRPQPIRHGGASRPNPESAASASPGAVLRQARRRHGLRLHQVADALRTRPDVIQALENDRFEVVGKPVFARMYLTDYAHLVGLSERDVLCRFDALGIDQPLPQQLLRTLSLGSANRYRRWPLYGLLAAVAGGLGWVSATHWLAPTSPRPLDGAQPAASVAPAPPVKLDGVADRPSGNSARAPVKAAAAGMQSTQGTNNAGTAVTSISTLRIEVDDKCWTNVQDAGGDQLIYGLLQAGASRSVSGAAPFTIKLGNAPAARITLDGNAVPRSLYVPKYGTVSKFVLNTPSSDRSSVRAH